MGFCFQSIVNDTLPGDQKPTLTGLNSYEPFREGPESRGPKYAGNSI